MKSFDPSVLYFGEILATIYMTLSALAVALLFAASFYGMSSGGYVWEYMSLFILAIGLSGVMYIRYQLLFHTTRGKHALMYKLFL